LLYPLLCSLTSLLLAPYFAHKTSSSRTQLFLLCLTGEDTPFLLISGGSGGFRLDIGDGAPSPVGQVFSNSPGGPRYQGPIFFVKPSKSYFFSSYNPCLDSDAVRLDDWLRAIQDVADAWGGVSRIFCRDCWMHKNCFHRPTSMTEAQDRIMLTTTAYARMVQGIFVSRWAPLLGFNALMLEFHWRRPPMRHTLKIHTSGHAPCRGTLSTVTKVIKFLFTVLGSSSWMENICAPSPQSAWRAPDCRIEIWNDVFDKNVYTQEELERPAFSAHSPRHRPWLTPRPELACLSGQ